MGKVFTLIALLAALIVPAGAQAFTAEAPHVWQNAAERYWANAGNPDAVRPVWIKIVVNNKADCRYPAVMGWAYIGAFYTWAPDVVYICARNNRRAGSSVAELCTTFGHEFGHLLGYRHYGRGLMAASNNGYILRGCRNA